MKTETRFWARVDMSGDCWLWLGAFFKDPRTKLPSYGRFNQGSTHRKAWELTHGPIEKGLSVLHRCDNKACVRPDHLFLGTQADNMKDRNQKGRTAHGERHAKAKLNASKIIQIRKDVREQRVIAAEYGVAPSLVNAIKQKKIWRHIE